MKPEVVSYPAQAEVMAARHLIRYAADVPGVALRDDESPGLGSDAQHQTLYAYLYAAEQCVDCDAGRVVRSWRRTPIEYRVTCPRGTRTWDIPEKRTTKTPYIPVLTSASIRLLVQDSYDLDGGSGSDSSGGTGK
jgi:hypothetical protein